MDFFDMNFYKYIKRRFIRRSLQCFRHCSNCGSTYDLFRDCKRYEPARSSESLDKTPNKSSGY